MDATLFVKENLRMCTKIDNCEDCRREFQSREVE